MIRLAKNNRYVAIVNEDNEDCAKRIKMDAVEIARIATGTNK